MIVVGGGVAGMAAAVALESVGISVTLLEARKSLGGRAGSYEDPQTGESLDNCQHVLLGCCTNLLDFYERIGATKKIRFERTIHLRDDVGRPFKLFGIRKLPAPLNLGPAMLRFGMLTWAERIQTARAMLAMMRLGRSGRLKLGDTSFGDWLDAHGQSPELVRKLYDPVLIGALNEDVRKANACYAIQVFQDSLLANEKGYPLGIPATTLGDLYGTLQCQDVRLGTRVSELVFVGATHASPAIGDRFSTDDACVAPTNSVCGVKLQSGETLDADAIVLATNHHTLDKWIPADLRACDRRFSGIDRLESVPILGTHLWFDRPILEDSHAAFVKGPLQWVFRKDAEGKAVHGVISAARDWVNRDRDEMLRLFEAQLQSMLPAAKDAKLIRGTVVIEKRATFGCVPGVDHLRPTQAPPADGIANLFLAGDYTLTGWPATMEGAARSGYLAADAIVKSFGIAGTKSFLVPDLVVQWPGQLLGLAR